jgi:hypothetical protein
VWPDQTDGQGAGLWTDIGDQVLEIIDAIAERLEAIEAELAVGRQSAA